MNDVIYLLIGGSGQWEDWHKWIVRAYLTDAEADRARKVAERQAVEAMEANKRDEPLETIRDRLTIDPEADIEEPTHYFVEAVEVAQGMPREATRRECGSGASAPASPVGSADAPTTPSQGVTHDPQG